MQTIVNDWLDFAAGTKKFDQSDFAFIFLVANDDVSLNQIFQVFSEREDLLECMKTYKKGAEVRKKSDKIRLSKDTAAVLVAEDVRHKSVAISESGDEEILAICDNKIQFISDYEEFENVKTNSWCHSERTVLINDYLLDKLVKKGPVEYSILESFYQIENNYDVSWYLSSPLLNSEIDFSIYMKLWSCGCDYALCEDAIFVYYEV